MKPLKIKKMKKIIILITIVTAGFTYSCKKDNPAPNKPCNCGIIQSDNVSNYSVDIKNDCSGNVKTWTLSQSDWMTAYVGSHYCITNTTSW
jgi:hypothetical protein